MLQHLDHQADLDAGAADDCSLQFFDELMHLETIGLTRVLM